jgi:hypothetical protein
MFDLKKNDPAAAAEVGYTFDVTLPDGTKAEAQITVRGANSPVVKNYSRKVYQELKVKEQQAKRRGKEYEMELEEAEELSARSAAVRIIDWKGFAEDGKEIKFSKDEAERLMQAYPFLRDQVTENSDNIYNFRTS